LTFIAVLDACVLIPAALRDILLRSAQAPLYRAQWTMDILNEVERNLVRNGMASQAGAVHLRAQIEKTFPDALIPSESYQLLISAMTNDAKDRHVLAAAVASHAQVIVTSNLKDFPNDALEPYGIEAQSPNEFLRHLQDLDQDLMLAIVREQASDLSRPPATVAQVIGNLARWAPDFAVRIRQAHEKQ
jgi:predicted nucleic acid-binding protein